MRYTFLPVAVIVLCLLLPVPNSAQDKVVVIPLNKALKAYAPLADASPSINAYSIGTNVVVDNVTGLTWQRTIAFGKNWDEAWSYCQNATTGRKRDWRLPSVMELTSIVDYGQYSPAFNTSVFPGFGTLDFGSCWSETLRATFNTMPWAIAIATGNTRTPSKSESLCAVCVRGKSVCCGNFKDSGNGTVMDLATGLTWQQQDDDKQRTWNKANQYCQGMSLGGRLDWRLPSVKELQSIVNYKTENPSINPTYFPGTNPTTYWSDTPAEWASGWAMIVEFENGNIWAESMSVHQAYVRCVR